MISQSVDVFHWRANNYMRRFYQGKASLVQFLHSSLVVAGVGGVLTFWDWHCKVRHLHEDAGLRKQVHRGQENQALRWIPAALLARWGNGKSCLEAQNGTKTILELPCICLLVSRILMSLYCSVLTSVCEKDVLKLRKEQKQYWNIYRSFSSTSFLSCISTACFSLPSLFSSLFFVFPQNFFLISSLFLSVPPFLLILISQNSSCPYVAMC